MLNPTSKGINLKASACDQSSAYNDFAFSFGDYAPSRVDHKVHAHEKEITALSISPSGNFAATGGADSLIKVWDINRGCVEPSIHKIFTKAVTSIQFSPDGEKILACSVDRQIKVCSIKPFKQLLSLSGHGDTINSSKFCYSQ